MRLDRLTVKVQEALQAAYGIADYEGLLANDTQTGDAA